MKKIFTFIFTACLFQISFAQQEVNKIDYSISIEESFKEKLKELEANETDPSDLFRTILEDMEGEIVLEAWIGKSANKIKSNLFQDWVYMRDTEAKTLFRIDTTTERYSEIAYLPENIEEYPITFKSEESATILGFPCKLAVIEIFSEDSSDESGKVEIWYTEKIPQIFWGNYQYLNQIPGAALKISTQGVAFYAKNIEKLKVSNDYFQVPKNYSIVADLDPIIDYKPENIELGEDMVAYYDSISFLYGLKTISGDIITEPNFLSLTAFNDGVSIAIDESNTSALINKKGKNITEYIYDFITYDSELNAYIYSKEDKMTVMDEHGKTIWSTEFDNINPFSSQYAIVSNGDKYGLVDKTGKIIVPLTYSSISSNNSKYFVVEENNKSAIYEIIGNKLVTDAYKFLFTTEMDDVFLASSDGETYGLINSTGKIILPFEYELIDVSGDGQVSVVKTGETDVKTIHIDPKK